MKGLYEKYNVTKIEGETDPDAVYFVLRLDKDPHAREAARAYANCVTVVEPQLSQDLHNLLNRIEKEML